jgi:formylglycine-generating enzyme required for sulfatase activity
LNRPNQPVVGVSWYEARAYCHWLSATSRQNISLPNEAEWEAAARRDRPWAYVYGPEFDPFKGNTAESHLLRTSPVGVFIGGQTPEGVYDLSGNVWEWTSTVWGEDRNQPQYGYPYDAYDGREDAEAPPQARRVVRVGSWDYDQYYARASARNYPLPDNRGSNHGFRVVRRPPSQNH